MRERVFSDSVRMVARRGLPPASLSAFAFAIVCVAAATGLRMLIDLIVPDAVPFATYFPAILIATLVGGVMAGVFAMLLGAVLSWWMFIPHQLEWFPLALSFIHISEPTR